MISTSKSEIVRAEYQNQGGQTAFILMQGALFLFFFFPFLFPYGALACRVGIIPRSKTLIGPFEDMLQWFLGMNQVRY